MDMPFETTQHLPHAVTVMIRAVEKIKYPTLLVFCSAFFVTMKFTYLDMLASSRLEYGNKILRHLG